MEKSPATEACNFLPEFTFIKVPVPRVIFKSPGCMHPEPNSEAD